VQSGTAAEGQYVNVASAEGLSAGVPVFDADPSHYFGARAGIDLEKETNGQDADAPPGPQVQLGDPLTWTYVVRNTGNVDLTGVTVTDDNGTPGDPGDDYVCVIGGLPEGAVDDTTCRQTGAAGAGQYGNVATAEGLAGATAVMDADASHYVGIAGDSFVFLPVVLKSSQRQ
jgi:hypothetical protein